MKPAVLTEYTRQRAKGESYSAIGDAIGNAAVNQARKEGGILAKLLKAGGGNPGTTAGGKQ